ncbi:hypothetical protein Dimus_024595 [Dionaea muscipula]
MEDNGLSNVMDLIKRQRSEKLFKRREFVHVDVVKKFYAREEIKRYDYFEETFLTMCKLIRENGIWWIGTGENRRRDDEIEAPEEEAEEEVETQNDFDWEAVIDEATDQGESGSREKFYDAEDEIQEPAAVVEEVPVVPA